MDARADSTPRSAAIVARLGQGIYQHQAPNGWPETGDGWINTGAILGRVNFGVALANGAVPGVSVRRWPLYAALDSMPREQQVDGVVRALLGGDVSAAMRAVLLSGTHPLLETSQQAGMNRPARPPQDGLAEVIGLAIGSPEFQRR